MQLSTRGTLAELGVSTNSTTHGVTPDDAGVLMTSCGSIRPTTSMLIVVVFINRGPPTGPAGANGGVELSWTPPGGAAQPIPADAYRMNDAITCMSPPPGGCRVRIR